MASAVAYRWTLRQLGEVLGVEAAEDDILRARGAAEFAGYARNLVQAANLDHLLIDDGYPPPDQAYSIAQMQSMLDVPVRRILRIETLVQDLIVTQDAPNTLVAAFDEIVSQARSSGCVALKSIAAYRTGLQIEPVDDRALESAFEPVRREAAWRGSIRLASKPMIDFFVWRAVRHASDQELPVQFHTGYGDPDLDLRLANPLHLCPLFDASSLAGAPIVLLHESYPFTAEAAYLAACYPNAYLDIAFSLPPLDRLQLAHAVQTALGAAPASKVMVSSDGTSIPEHYYLGAIRARQIVSEVLEKMVDVGELSLEDAQELGAMVLRDNARHVYGLT